MLPAAACDQQEEASGTELEDMLLVAVHPWDIDGGARAGTSTAWVNRRGAPYPHLTSPHPTAPTHTVHALGELAAELG